MYIVKKTKLVYIDVGPTLIKHKTRFERSKHFSIAPLLLVKNNGDVNNVSRVQLVIVAQVETNNFKLEDVSGGGGAMIGNLYISPSGNSK